MKCPNCGNSELKTLVEGIWQCPKCNKIIKNKIESNEEEPGESTFESGDFFIRNTGLNKKYEICEKGIIISKTPKFMIAALICHSPSFPNSKYIRISWFKNSIYLHAGMIKITESSELNNLIKCLEKIDNDFDQDFNFNTAENDTELDFEEQEDLFKLDGTKCPKCSDDSLQVLPDKLVRSDRIMNPWVFQSLSEAVFLSVGTYAIVPDNFVYPARSEAAVADLCRRYLKQPPNGH